MDENNNDTYVPTTAGTVMPEVIDEFPPMPLKVRIGARVLADVVGTGVWASGKRPKSLAQSCIYTADMVYNRDDRFSQDAIQKITGTSHVTIRKHYRKIPKVFVENADGEDYERFEDPELFRERLTKFKEAEENGERIHDLLDDE